VDGRTADGYKLLTLPAAVTLCRVRKIPRCIQRTLTASIPTRVGALPGPAPSARVPGNEALPVRGALTRAAHPYPALPGAPRSQDTTR